MASSNDKHDSGSAAPSGVPGVNLGERFAGVYEIVRLLGEGGMGSVYLARDTRSGGREVALKILHPRPHRPGLTLGGGASSFSSFGVQSSEARLLASCEHPSILPVFDAGMDHATGLSFFTMRACLLTRDEMTHLCDEALRCPYPRSRSRWDDGPAALSLRDLLKGGKVLPEAAVARIGIDIVEALAYTHARRPPLVHRDIKPSNILFDATGRAILSDFGIAKELFDTTDAATPDSSAPAAKRRFAGTSSYASPEQLAGAPATPASDYYSLGVVLHEALTGERLFGFSPPSAFDPACISRKWDSLLERLLVANPRERLDDPDAILRTLHAILDAPTRRRRFVAAAVAVGAAAVAAAIVAGLAVESGPRPSAKEIEQSLPATSETAPPDAATTFAWRTNEVARQVLLIKSSPEWPMPSTAWFPEFVFPLRPENNRRYLGGNVFEMLLPDGTPMQFVSMALGAEPRYIDYYHGYFNEGKGRPNMRAEERAAMRTVVSKRLLFSRTEVTREQFAAVMSATNDVPLRETRLADWTNAPAAMASMGMGPKEFFSRLRYYMDIVERAGKSLSDYRCQSVFLRVAQEASPQIGLPAAEGLRFADVERFVARLNALCPPGCVFRLPSEAEWEAMCRMKNVQRFEGDNPDDVCWSRENSGGGPHPVAQKKAGYLGIYDMHGNVAEWCLDGFGPLERPAFDPVTPVSADGLHVVRGGSWADPVEGCGSECRRAAGPDETGIGIRLVLEY